MTYDDYARAKLRDAAISVGDEARPIKDRLRAAYAHGLATVQTDRIEDNDLRHGIEDIVAALARYGEAIEGEGAVPTTLWTMTDEEADAISNQILVLRAHHPG